MTDLILTEELLKEFLDPVSAKAYVYFVEDKLPANCKYQASFTDDHGKLYFISFFRDTTLGKNSRKVVLSVKKNKSTTYKVNIDKGSFIKILGTIIQVYQEYKLGNTDGMQTSSYGFYFPDTFAKYMPFVVKVVNRLFKTTPKAKLMLAGAQESFEGSTILYYVNPNSHIPYFGGSKAEAKDIQTEFYFSLIGEPVPKKETDHTPTAAEKSKPEINKPSFKVETPYEPGKAAVKQVDTPQQVSQEDKWIEPSLTPVNYNFGGKDSRKIRAEVDTGSSSLTKGKEALIYGLYNIETFGKIFKKQFEINDNAAAKVLESEWALIVKPVGTSNKFVAIGLNDKETTKDNSKVSYADEYGNFDEPSKIELSSPSQKLNAHQIQDLPTDFYSTLEKLQIDFGPVKLNLGSSGDTSIIGLAEKIREVQIFFQSNLPPEVIEQQYNSMIYSVSDASMKLSRSINKFLGQQGLFFVGGSSSPEAIQSVEYYTASGYRPINRYLRGDTGNMNDDTKQNIAEHIQKVDTAFADAGVRFPRNLNVYRGASISLEEIDTLNQSKRIPLSGYASVSLRPDIAYSFGNFGGGKGSKLLRGALLNIGLSEDDTENLPDMYVESKRGNKILYSINRLDRCLSLAVDRMSSNSGEDELLLNRGTEINNRPNSRVMKVVNSSQDKDVGIWIAKVEISPIAISESSMRNFLLREALNKASEAQDALAILTFCLEDIGEALQLK